MAIAAGAATRTVRLKPDTTTVRIKPDATTVRRKPGTTYMAHVAYVATSEAAGVAEALLLGHSMPPPDATTGLPSDVQKRLVEYRQRESTFKSGLRPPPGADEDERALYERRVAIERVIFCLFPRGDVARVASGFALDADLDHEAPFIDGLLRDLPVSWLAPYLNLIAGRSKLCDGQVDSGRRQLERARGGGHPIVRVVAQHLLETVRCVAE
jgi:hypothetical protein